MMNGEFFDNGVLLVFVPFGWKLFCGSDSGGKVTSKKLHIYKGAQTEMDIFTKAGITICFYGKNEIYISTRSFYDNVCEIESFELRGNLWKGYTCTSLGYPYTMLESTHDGATFQVMILMKNGECEISLDDADVIKILESLATSCFEEGVLWDF